MSRWKCLYPIRLVLAGGIGFIFAGNAAAQGVDYVRSHYTKYEYRIPMRDGTRLFTSVYVPIDQSTTYPIMFKRTPYSVKPYGVDRFPGKLGPSRLFGKDGYIFAYQDVRGRWKSEGKFLNVRPHRPHKDGPEDVDESTDTYDTIDWLVKNVANHNGKVGIWGLSYPGFYTAAGIIDAHPAVKAASPQATIGDWFITDDWHHNGAFFLPHMFNFMYTSDLFTPNLGQVSPTETKQPNFPFEYGTKDGYQFYLRMGPVANANAKYFKGKSAFWNAAMQHGTYDEYWKSRTLIPHLKDIRPAVMTVGGWFDAENLSGSLETYKQIESSSNTFNILVMGPWRHGGWSRSDGDSFAGIQFDSNTGPYYREKIEFPFFQYYLKGKGDLKHPEAWVFETGTNQWREYDKWPPKSSRLKSLHFRSGGRLSFDPPDSPGSTAFDEYLSDPAKPVPYIDKIGITMLAEYMVADQRFAARRPDVLVFETEELESDVTIVGQPEVELFVSTSGTDSDWIVKLIDVYPDDYPNPDPNPKEIQMRGYQQLVRCEVMRGKFRNSFEKPEPFTPHKPTRVRFKLPDIAHGFRKGHRIMVQVQSSWFPLVDRNPQKFVDIYSAKEADFRKATQRVYRSSDKASRLNVHVLP